MGNIRDHLQSTAFGNKNAFGEVVAAYSGMAMAMAMRRLGNKALAEEAVQEAFLTAYLNLPKLRDPEAFSAWLRTILARCCSKIRRKEAASERLPEELHLLDMLGLDPCDIYARQLDVARIRDLLHGLSGACREACILRYVHGRPYAEIAETLGVPVGTIKRRLHQARDKILREFAESERPAIRVGHMPISDHLLGMVAHHRHDHRAYDMHLKRFLSWGRLIQSLSQGGLDAAFVMAPLAMAMRNSGLGIRYVLDGHHDGSAITMSSASGDSLGHASRMALPHAISTHMLLLRNMLVGHPDQGHQACGGDMPMRFINPSYVINSLLKREIDGFFCSEPWSTKSTAQGAGRIVARSRDLEPGHICCILVVRDEFSKNHGDLLRDYVRGLARAGEFITARPAESAKIQARYTGVDQDVAEHILVNGHITFEDLAPDTGRAMRVMQMALEANMLDRPCDLDRFMLPGCL